MSDERVRERVSRNDDVQQEAARVSFLLTRLVPAVVLVVLGGSDAARLPRLAA